MAPFNTHFLVAERIWPEVTARLSLPETGNGNYFGQFCFGCIAPDVDKISATLSQKDTHFYDRSTDYDLMASHRTVAFLKHQREFFCAPFPDLSPEAQAFGLGYLCHLCVDEVSKHMWRREVWLQLKPVYPGTSFAALDEAAMQRIQNFAAIREAVCSIKVLDVIPCIPFTDLKQMLGGTCCFVRATTIEEAFMALVDFFDKPGPEERHQKQTFLRTQLNIARRQIHVFTIDELVNAALTHSRRRLNDLIQGRIPEPGYPELQVSAW